MKPFFDIWDNVPDVMKDEYFEPDDYDGLDIGSATVQEMRVQNGDY